MRARNSAIPYTSEGTGIGWLAARSDEKGLKRHRPAGLKKEDAASGVQPQQLHPEKSSPAYPDLRLALEPEPGVSAELDLAFEKPPGA
jgi:hypothetical protein